MGGRLKRAVIFEREDEHNALSFRSGERVIIVGASLMQREDVGRGGGGGVQIGGRK